MLAPRHQDFLNEYLINGYNSTAAYMKSYDVSYKSANMNSWIVLNREDVQQELKKRQKKMVEDNDISRAEIISELKEMIADCKNDKDRNSLIKCLDQLNKMAGHYTENKNIKMDGPIQISFGGGFDPSEKEEEKSEDGEERAD